MNNLLLLLLLLVISLFVACAVLIFKVPPRLFNANDQAKATAVRAEPKPPETKLSMVVTYGFEVTDPAKIPTEYMIPDEKTIGAVIRASKGSVQIPGVRVVKRETVR